MSPADRRRGALSAAARTRHRALSGHRRSGRQTRDAPGSPRRGRVFEVAHDHFLVRGASELADLICELTGPRREAVHRAQLRDRLNISRKIAVHILEFFDRHGATAAARRFAAGECGAAGAISERRPDVESQLGRGREAFLVGRPDFKSGRGRKPVFGGFDSHSLPPPKRSRRQIVSSTVTCPRCKRYVHLIQRAPLPAGLTGEMRTFRV